MLTAEGGLACVTGADPSAERPLGTVTGLGDEVLVGMGAIVLDGAVIGERD